MNYVPTFPHKPVHPPAELAPSAFPCSQVRATAGKRVARTVPGPAPRSNSRRPARSSSPLAFSSIFVSFCLILGGAPDRGTILIPFSTCRPAHLKRLCSASATTRSVERGAVFPTALL
ncbi:hypothetical protein CALVIDRAFT_537466 [Calocera viscosa TUFC12733]|uniref:Uncharacterized protein n=1 Tax=Calocera viscosa (strain TUFC12733) TaxID=1330018 RepID=A0A167M3H7_CALVF|nr:hypothetical protein CALVIDRAFT_537466 [Calocera viscosa TUFC12733]